MHAHPSPIAPDATRAEAESLPGLEIAFLVPEDRQTGTYFRFHNLAIALLALGHRVTVYSQSNESRLRTTTAIRDGVPYVFSPTVGGNRVLISPVNPGNVLRRLLMNVPPADVYHLFQPYPSAAIAWLAMLHRRPGVFVYDWDDFWMNDEFGLKTPHNLNTHVTALWVRFLESYLPGRCDLLTTLSHKLAALGRRRLCRNSEIIYNGVWNEEVPDRLEARRTLGLRKDAIYAGMMGWSGEAEWAFAGMQAHASRFPTLRLGWCGRHPTSALDRFPGLKDRIDVLGHLSDAHLRFFKRAMNVGLIPMAATEFNQYRLPYKLTDFLSSGTPVLASDIGETSIVARKLPGVTLCAHTREAWIESFGRAVAASIHPENSRGVDRTCLLENFEWKRIASRLAAAYRSARVSIRRAA